MAVQLNDLHDDKFLFARIAEGDQLAFSKVFYSFGGRIYSFVHKITRSATLTEEIVQDVFVNIWKKKDSLHEIEQPASWIFTIAANLTYNHLRAEARARKAEEALRTRETETTNNPDERLDAKEFEELIKKTVDLLPEQRRIIYKMSREDGLTHEEIAQKLNISKNTVKNQLVQALKFIRQQVQQRSGNIFPILLSVWIEIHQNF